MSADRPKSDTLNRDGDVPPDPSVTRPDATKPSFPAPASQSHVGLLLNDRYEIEREIGRGGIGVVYLAHDRHLLAKPVVVKVLLKASVRDDWVQRKFRHEIEALARIDHPGIVSVYDADEMPDGTPYLVMQYVEGETLRACLTRGPLPLDQAAALVRQIGSALDAAHERGIFHRDLKPENIMLQDLGGGERQAKVIDFGIARVENSLTTEETTDDIIAGSLAYITPEQLSAGTITAATDLYALGIIAYEMVTGRRPFATPRSIVELVDERRRNAPNPPRELRPELSEAAEAAILRALAFAPERRFRRIRDFAETFARGCASASSEFADTLKHDPDEFPTYRFDEAAPSKPVPAEETQATQPMPTDPGLLRRRRGLFGAAAAGVLAVAAFGALYQTGRPPVLAPVVAPAGPRTLAILPFRNLKPDANTDFLGFSLADTLTTKLATIRTLVVRPSSYVERYREHPPDPQQVARDLAVDTLLTGTYMKDGNELRITAQLIDLRANQVIWQDTLDEKFDQLLTVQDRVARTIVEQMRLSLSPSENAGLQSDVSRDPLAYRYYLQAIDLDSAHQFDAAIKMLEKSLEIDPRSAAAWAFLGKVCGHVSSFQFGGVGYNVRAEEAFRKALALDPTLADANVFLANRYTDTNRVEQAIPLLRNALRTNPNHAEAHWELGYAYRFAGLLPESVAECELARRIDPNVKLTTSAFNSYLYIGDYRKFLASLHDPESAPFLLFYRGFAHYHLKEFDRARGDFDRAYAADSNLLQARIGKALSYGLSGQRDAGRAMLREVERKIEEQQVMDAEAIYKVAQGYAALGDRAAALRLLRRSIAEGFFSYPYITADPLFADLRADAEYISIVDLARRRHEAFRQSISEK